MKKIAILMTVLMAIPVCMSGCSVRKVRFTIADAAPDVLEINLAVDSQKIDQKAQELAEKLSAHLSCPVRFVKSADAGQASICIDGDGRSLFSKEFTIAVQNGKLMIHGKGETAILSALDYFSDSILGDMKTDVSIPGDFSYTGNCGWKYVSADDPALSYLGRWSDDGSGTRISYWTTPSVSFQFTGETLVVDLAGKSSLGVELDGVTADYYEADGAFEIKIPKAGSHTVKLYGPNIRLNGFWLDPDAEISPSEKKDHYVMFIGDSISASHSSFSFRAGKEAGWDWTVFALDGIALCDGFGYYTATNLTGWGYYTNGYYKNDALAGWNESMRIGMETAFFQYERPIDKRTDFTPYPFGDREPDLIVIALGCNDYLLNSAQKELFVGSYKKFVKNIRAQYPNAAIRILQALTDNGAGLRQGAIREAAEAIVQEDGNAAFISDTVSWGVEISSDGTHPTKNGYDVLTGKIKQMLEEEVSK